MELAGRGFCEGEREKERAGEGGGEWELEKRILIDGIVCQMLFGIHLLHGESRPLCDAR